MEDDDNEGEIQEHSVSQKSDNQEEGEGGNKLTCAECTFSKCGFAGVKNKYSDCEECKEGIMLIHPSKKDDYFAICNNQECCLSYQISSFTKSLKLTKKCENCKKRKMINVNLFMLKTSLVQFQKKAYNVQ